MIVTPVRVEASTPPAVRCSVEVKKRGPVEAPTVVIPRRAVLDGAGGGAVVAGRRVDRDAGVERVEERELDRVGVRVGAAPPIEKLMTLTPSRIACWTAAIESESKQPCERQTRYSITCAPGATPQTRAAVDAVEHGRGDAVAGGGRRRVRAVALGVARRADAGRVVAELLARRSRSRLR